MIFGEWHRKIWLGKKTKLRKPEWKRVVTLRLICENFVKNVFHVYTGTKVRSPEWKMLFRLRLI